MNKNAEWSETSEKSFSFLKLNRVSFPNNTHCFTLQAAGSDEPGVEINAKPDELTRELMALAKWVSED